jgi:restriction endonuclease S subunit
MISIPKMQLAEFSEIRITRGFGSQRSSSGGQIQVASLSHLIQAEASNKFTTQHEIERQGLFLPRKGDILLAVEGSVGGVYVVRGNEPAFVPSRQMVILQFLTEERLVGKYFAAWLSSPSGKFALESVARGVTLQRVSLADLNSIKIPVPPIEVQRKIGERFEAFGDAIHTHEQIVLTLRQMRENDVRWRTQELN